MIAVVIALAMLSTFLLIMCLAQHQRYVGLHRRFVSLNIHHGEFVQQHEQMVKFWEGLNIDIIKDQISNYFADSTITNKVIRAKNGRLEILIGDENNLVAVDMDKEDMFLALDEAYFKFLSEVNDV